MTPENFCYWLKGFIELQNPETMTKEQVDEVKRHLNMVFNIIPTQQSNFTYVLPSNIIAGYHNNIYYTGLNEVEPYKSNPNLYNKQFIDTVAYSC